MRMLLEKQSKVENRIMQGSRIGDAVRSLMNGKNVNVHWTLFNSES